MFGGLVLSLMATLQALPAETVTRASCDAVAHVLLWQTYGATVRVDDQGLKLVVTQPGQVSEPPTTDKPRLSVSLDASCNLSIRGASVDICQDQSCQPLGDMPMTVQAALGDGQGAILASNTPNPGVYRASFAAFFSPTLLAAGDVLALCPSGQGAWALVSNGEEVSLVVVSVQRADLTTYSFGDAVLAAARFALQDVVAMRQAIATLATQNTPALDALALVIANDPRAQMRSLAGQLLARNPSGSAAAKLSELARDPDLHVRQAAFDAVSDALETLPAAVGSVRLGLFVNDSIQDISWGARDQLLMRSADLALAGASKAYKLDAISILIARQERDGPEAVRKPLRLLISDEDATVRAAAMALAGGVAP